MISVLVCGSVSYDTITHYPESFSSHVLHQQDQFPDLAFHVSEMRNELGGCAVNICYNLKLLKCNAAPVATVGDDFDEYKSKLEVYNITTEYIKHISNTNTAHYFNTIDKDESQIVVFHAGAMDHSHENIICFPDSIKLGVISPDAILGMKLHAEQFVEKNIPFIFDPGPNTRLLGTEDLDYYIKNADWIILNNHEWELLQRKTKLTNERIINQVEALIITNGSNGSQILTNDAVFNISAATVSNVKDPTGCGDAYRAGIIHGIFEQLNWQTVGQIATVMGAICAEHGGAQNHMFTMEEFHSRYRKNYGDL